MDRMHDELLKFEGHYSSSNGGSLPLVSSSEDDGWETVGPKNKSAVTRTQSFIPSELSAIFGGQLRSVVKARGMFEKSIMQSVRFSSSFSIAYRIPSLEFQSFDMPLAIFLLINNRLLSI